MSEIIKNCHRFRQVINGAKQAYLFQPPHTSLALPACVSVPLACCSLI